MASSLPPTQQREMPSLPLYPFTTNHHLMAPGPNMEMLSALPVKRGPEDEVQFVSAHSVKKCRGSRESTPAQDQQAAAEQSNSVHQTQGLMSGAEDNRDSPCSPAARGPSPGKPQPAIHRVVSVPMNMGDYVFPPPPVTTPSQILRSSPMLSPKQLPQTMLRRPAADHFPAHPSIAATTTGLPPPMHQRGLHVPWGMAGLYPQPAPVEPNPNWNPLAPLPPVEPQHSGKPAEKQSPELSPRRSLAPNKDSWPVSPPACLSQRREDVSSQHVHEAESNRTRKTPEPQRSADRPPADQAVDVSARPASPAPPFSPLPPLPQAETSAQPQHLAQAPFSTSPPTTTQTHQEVPTTTAAAAATACNSDMPTSAQQPQAIKPPCLICEQMRQQQALINQANNIPVGNGTPHLQQHGWHGLNAFQQQLHLAHQAAMGTNVGMQNFQLRFQPLLPAQLPMGYAIPQVPGHVPMSMQRVGVASNMSAGEQLQGGGGIFPIQGNQNQAQQASTNQVLPQTYTGVTQFLRPEFYQNQIQPPQQAIQTLKPVLASPHAPVPAVLASPALPATAQSSGPSPTSQAPQPAATTAATAAEPRKPSPNLIVDIAETCEEIFPWDEVAKRHGVSRVKVVDTFAAVIQLPLLRCTTDKKRHGKLATSRLREYTKAKKDVEAANSPSATKTTTTPTKSTTTAAATATVPIQACLSRPPQSCEGQLHTKQAPHATQDRPLLPGVLEMANTMAPLGLPSTLTNGLAGPWQQ